MASALALMLTFASAVAATGAPIRVSGQLLDYEKGFVFFTTGDGFRMAPGARILDYKTGAPTTLVPRPRDWARATFDASGQVTELDLSRTKIPLEGSFADVQRFAVALSPAIPNPDLAGPTPGPNGLTIRYTGKIVTVLFTVQVPPTTPLDSAIYMTTDQSGWNPQAYRMDRVDALHYQLTLHLPSGTVLHVLFTRGSIDTEQRGPGNMEVQPPTIVVTDADVRDIPFTVYTWADQAPNGQVQQPFVLPTPYNPAPFPNLPPGAPGAGRTPPP